MRICAGLACTELTLFSRLGATSGATNRQSSFPFGCHGYIVHCCSAQSWSIVTSTFNSGPQHSIVFIKTRFSSVSASQNEYR